MGERDRSTRGAASGIDIGTDETIAGIEVAAAGIGSDVGGDIVAGGTDDMEGASDVVASDDGPVDGAEPPSVVGASFPSDGGRDA